MGEWLLKKVNWAAGFLSVIVLFGVIVYTANIEIKDLDLWLHLAMGKHIVETGTIPTTDILSATLRGANWVNHEWLFQVIVYFLYNSFGPDGLITMQVLLIGLTFSLLLMLGYREELQLVPVTILFFVFMVLQLRFTHRPDLFSLLFFVIYFLILSSQLERKISLLFLFVIQILWNNIHGFFIFGPMIVFIGLLGEWIKRHVPLPYSWNEIARLTDKEYSRLKYALGIVLLACLCNPHFLHGALYPFRILVSVSGQSKLFFKHIGELRKPIDLSNIFVWSRFFYYKMLIVLSGISFVINRKRLDVGLFLFWLFVLIFSLNANRNVVYFAVASYLVIIANLQPLLDVEKIKSLFYQKRGAVILSIAGKIFLVVFMLNFVQKISTQGYFDFDNNVRKGEYAGGLSLRNFPYKAVNFLIDNKIQGNFFNDFNSGAYLLGRCFPDIHVFIDGRTEVYGADYFESYRKAYDGDVEELKKIFDQYDLTGAFLGAVYVPANENTSSFFYDSPQWALVYFDYDATIFLKRVPENERIINQFEVDLSREPVLAADLISLGVNRVTPYRNINRANAFLNLGYDEKAREEALEAVKISPYNPEAYDLLGKIAFKNNYFAEALENYRKAKLVGGNNIPVTIKLAECFYRLGAYSRAQEQCQKVLEAGQNASAYYLLSLTMLKGKTPDPEKAYQLAMRGYEVSQKASPLLTEIGNEFYELKETRKALNILQTVVKLENDEEQLREMNNKIEHLKSL